MQTAPQVYVVFWGWSSDPSGEQPYLESFLSSVGGTPWLSTVNEYGAGSSGDLLAGTWSDPSAIPDSPSDADIQAEALSAANHFGASNSVNVQIVVATPTGHSTPGFGTSFCAYHGAVAADPDITYTNLPYMTDVGGTCGEGTVNGANGTLDGVSIVEGHELAETITDPLINAWIDANGQEIGDKCAWMDLGNITTSQGTFAIQPLWSNNANACVRAPGSGGGESVSLEYQTPITTSSTTQLEPYFVLFNNGTTTISLSDITIRYWFTEDGTEPLSFACDFATVGCANISGAFNTTALGGQDHYLELSFGPGAGTLAPGANTGFIQTRVNKQDFTSMTQTNDYSFTADTSLAVNPQITVYDNGTLIFGAEP